MSPDVSYLVRTFYECLAWMHLLFFASARRVLAAGHGLLLGPTTEVVTVNGRRFRLLRVLGEGAYAYVHLCQELLTSESTLPDGMEYALKKVLVHSPEAQAAVEHEMAVHRRLNHPNLLRLLDAAIVGAPSVSVGSGSGRRAQNMPIAYLLFPAYKDGTLSDELSRLATQGSLLSTCDVLDICSQMCLGLQHMHAAGLRHGDVKPLNTLITCPGAHSAVGALLPPAARTSLGDTAADVAELGSACTRYEVVLMDFGSARPSLQRVTNRAQALALQEDAEAHCTATYRAPELFDVPSQCSVGTAADVWALGCSLYAIMYGESPFQKALDEASSLALAVMSCHVTWPADLSRRYPQPLHDLVLACLQVDPIRRPTMAQLLGQLAALQRRLAPAGDLVDPLWGRRRVA